MLAVPRRQVFCRWYISYYYYCSHCCCRYKKRDKYNQKWKKESTCIKFVTMRHIQKIAKSMSHNLQKYNASCPLIWENEKEWKPKSNYPHHCITCKLWNHTWQKTWKYFRKSRSFCLFLIICRAYIFELDKVQL